MFSVIRLGSYGNFFIGKVSQVLYFPSNALVKIEHLEEEFLRSFFSSFALLAIGIYDPVSLQISCIRNETRLKKLTENYGKFICNIFGWNTVKMWIIRAKIQVGVWI